MSSGFISEAEIAEAKKRRQEEWEKVRTEDQPEEAPEEAFDPRPLYQRLEEQKNKRDADYEEAHKLKNMIRGLDDDEVGFLEQVEHQKANVARQISLEEQREMRDFRERVSTVQDSVERERLQQISGIRPTPANSHKKPSPNNIRNKLQGVIVRKRKTSETDSAKSEEPQAKVSTSSTNGNSGNSNNSSENGVHSTEIPPPSLPAAAVSVAAVSGGLRCIGVLPGIGPYRDSSDSECSSDSDDAPHSHSHFDLLGRKQESKQHKPAEKTLNIS